MIKTKGDNVYAFIDGQNLNLGTRKNIYKSGKLIYKGWVLDYKKFRQYLFDKFRVNKAFYFIGYIKQNRILYDRLKRFGYDLVFKPTVKDNSGKPKGNVDAELVLHASAIEFPNFKKAVIVAGDGDYRCLAEFLKEKDKLLRIVIPNEKSESTLLKVFQEYKTFLSFEREKLEYKANKMGGVARRHVV